MTDNANYQLVYLMAPFGGKQENLTRASAWCAFLSSEFEALFSAPWIPICRLWPNNGLDLVRGYELDKFAIRRFDSCIAVGGKWSTGMLPERSYAEQLGKLVLDATSFETPNQLLDDEDTMAQLAAVYGKAKR